jgi:hypothetical protein
MPKFRVLHLAAAIGVAWSIGASTGARAVEPGALTALAAGAPATPWPAGDEARHSQHLNDATTLRCGWHMSQRVRTYEASFVRSNTMPKSPFANPSLSKPKPTAGVPFSAHAFNGEAFDASAEPQQQGTQIDAIRPFRLDPRPVGPQRSVLGGRRELLRRLQAAGTSSRLPTRRC